MTLHTIEAVTFPKGTSDGPCECSCSWTGLASEFGAHRRDSGLLTSKPHKAVPSERDMPSAWRRPLRTCIFSGCNKPLAHKGLCRGHYDQQRAGKELRKLRDFAA
jgi:hypothetical protein